MHHINIRSKGKQFKAIVLSVHMQKSIKYSNWSNMLVSFVTGYLIGQISVHCTTYFSALKVWKNKNIFRNELF